MPRLVRGSAAAGRRARQVQSYDIFSRRRAVMLEQPGLAKARGCTARHDTALWTGNCCK